MVIYHKCQANTLASQCHFCLNSFTQAFFSLLKALTLYIQFVLVLLIHFWDLGLVTYKNTSINNVILIFSLSSFYYWHWLWYGWQYGQINNFTLWFSKNKWYFNFLFRTSNFSEPPSMWMIKSYTKYLNISKLLFPKIINFKASNYKLFQLFLRGYHHNSLAKHFTLCPLVTYLWLKLLKWPSEHNICNCQTSLNNSSTEILYWNRTTY